MVGQPVNKEFGSVAVTFLSKSWPQRPVYGIRNHDDLHHDHPGSEGIKIETLCPTWTHVEHGML